MHLHYYFELFFFKRESMKINEQIIKYVPLMPMKKIPQAQLQIQPSRKKTVPSNCNNPIPKLAKQLNTRLDMSMSSFLLQQKLEKPATIVPEKQNSIKK